MPVFGGSWSTSSNLVLAVKIVFIITAHRTLQYINSLHAIQLSVYCIDFDIYFESIYYYHYYINQKFAITYPSFTYITTANIFFSGDDLYKLKTFYQNLYQIILCSIHMNYCK